MPVHRNLIDLARTRIVSLDFLWSILADIVGKDFYPQNLATMPFDSAIPANESTTSMGAKRLGQSLRLARKKAGLSQRALAARADVDLATVRGLEHGRGTVSPLLLIMQVLAVRFVNHQCPEDFGRWMALNRKASELSQEALAVKAKLSKPTISQIEKGRGNIRSLLSAMAVLNVDCALASTATKKCDIKIISRDCFDALPQISGVSLAITSPPYLNMGMEYGDSFDSVDAYIDFTAGYVDGVARTLKSDGALWINVGHHKLSDTSRVPLTYYLWPVFRDSGLTMVQEVIWDRQRHVATTNRLSTRSERWVWLVKNPNKFVFNLDDIRQPLKQRDDQRNHPLGANPSDIWTYAPVQGTEKHGHVCPFPRAMIERIVLACSNEGDVVMDPFAGSGTTGAAALKHGRRVILIERNEKYASALRDRWQDASLGA